MLLHRCCSNNVAMLLVIVLDIICVVLPFMETPWALRHHNGCRKQLCQHHTIDRCGGKGRREIFEDHNDMCSNSSGCYVVLLLPFSVFGLCDYPEN